MPLTDRCRWPAKRTLRSASAWRTLCEPSTWHLDNHSNFSPTAWFTDKRSIWYGRHSDSPPPWRVCAWQRERTWRIAQPCTFDDKQTHTHTHTRTPDSSTSIMPHTFSLPLASPAHQPERRHPGLRERPRAPKQTSRLAAGLRGGLFTGRGRGRKSREKVDMISYCMSHRKVLQVLLLSKLILVFISLNLSALLYFHSSTS